MMLEMHGMSTESSVQAHSGRRVFVPALALVALLAMAGNHAVCRLTGEPSKVSRLR